MEGAVGSVQRGESGERIEVNSPAGVVGADQGALGGVGVEEQGGAEGQCALPLAVGTEVQ